MTGFEDYTEEMEAFERSTLYPQTYNTIVNYLYKHINQEPTYSNEIEAACGIRDSEVRAVVRHAKRSGHLLISKGKGYCMVDTMEALEEGNKHLKERIRSMEFTLMMQMKNLRREKLKDTIEMDLK